MSRWFKRLAVPALAVLMTVAFIGSAQAVRSIEPTGETPGDVVIYPYYDVSSADNFNYFYLVNTVNYYVQAHVRFRTSECSIECLDFDVILTPYDVLTFLVLPEVTDADGITGPGFFSWDSHTMGLVKGSLIFSKYYDSNGYVTIAFNDQRLTDLHISASDAQDMLKKGYVEVIVEGLIDPSFWNECGPFGSLLAAAKTDVLNGCTWDKNNVGSFANTAAIFEGVAAEETALDHVGKTTSGGSVLIDNGELLYGTEYFFNVATASGYGVNAATITAFRTADDNADDTYDRHIDDGYVADPTTGLVSGRNGLILHRPHIGDDMTNGNPFFRPDWATTFGPTLAFGDDMDAETAGNPLVYGSVDDLEELWFNNMMNTNTYYTAPYFSDLDVLKSYLMLNFFTKHYHYFTKLLYDPNTQYNTHGYVAPVAGVATFHAVDRLADVNYNFSLTGSLACGQAFWNVSFVFRAWDNDEHPVPGTASPGTVKYITHEALFELVGPGADLLNTGQYVEGFYMVGDFELEHDDARAERTCDAVAANFYNFQAINALACTGDFAGATGEEIYDVVVNDVDTPNFVPAIGYNVIEISGLGSFSYDLTIVNSPWAANVAFNPLNNPLNGMIAPAAP